MPAGSQKTHTFWGGGGLKALSLVSWPFCLHSLHSTLLPEDMKEYPCSNVRGTCHEPQISLSNSSRLRMKNCAVGLWLTPAHCKPPPPRNICMAAFVIYALFKCRSETFHKSHTRRERQRTVTLGLFRLVVVKILHCHQSQLVNIEWSVPRPYPCWYRAKIWPSLAPRWAVPGELLSPHLHPFEWISALLHLSASLTLWFLVVELPSLSSRSAGWR